MVDTIISHMPPMPVRFDPHLLSAPSFGFSTKNLLKIAKFLDEDLEDTPLGRGYVVRRDEPVGDKM
jgi:hypothetical protein